MNTFKLNGNQIDSGNGQDRPAGFLCSLGASFEAFFITIRASKPTPAFQDLLSQAESQEFMNKQSTVFFTITLQE